MASVQPYTLFPSEVPRLGLPNPHRRASSLHSVKMMEEGKSSQQQDIHAASRKITLKAPPVPDLPIELKPIPYRSASAQSDAPSAMTVNSRSSPQSSSTTPATSVSSLNSQEGPHEKSPTVPIRSIFPTIDLTKPLSQQIQPPQMPPPVFARPSGTNFSRHGYSDSMLGPLDRAIGAKTAPSSIYVPADNASLLETQFSSSKKLEDLWTATHGEVGKDTKSFNLELTRISEAEFTFGSDPQTPFYTLKTFDSNELSITKTNPKKRISTFEIVFSSIEPLSRRLTGDGLVTFIFPKLAAMMAINQSADLARQHGLASTDRDEMESAALRRAAEQEACNLQWNAAQRRYELSHPRIGRSRHEPTFVMSPDMSARPTIPSPLHITVSQRTRGSSKPGVSNLPPVILVTYPSAATSPAEETWQGIRMSTIPQSDRDTVLASLDFGINSLYINSAEILELIPSLFAVDCVVSAIMAVAVADDSTNTVMSQIPVFTPSTSTPRSKSLSSYSVTSTKTTNTRPIYATLAEREEAEAEAMAMRQDHQQDVKKSRRATGLPGRSWFGSNRHASTRKDKQSKSKEAKKNKQLVVEEFDLEKWGHYQSGDREGQELPSVVRGVLSLLIMGLKLLVWILTTIVKCLAWMLIHGSRAVTSEKL